MTIFVKRYATPATLRAAQTHHAWLVGLNADVRLPRLLDRFNDGLAFEPMPGDIPGPVRMPIVAAAIGRLHTAAAPRLRDSRLDRPHDVGACELADFIHTRRHRLHDTARTHHIPITAVDRVLEAASALPASLYKDSNLRNFLITDTDGVAIVDFDDLTLAPYGYDLAKLVVSMAMTHGPLDTNVIAMALDAYNSALGQVRCTPEDLAIWAELNWLLTTPYTGRNGYHQHWPSLRPWPHPLTRRL